MRDWWENSDLILFRVSPNTLIVSWLGYSTINSVWWNTDNRGRFKIHGVLPFSKALDDLGDGDTIEILRRAYGPLDEYDASFVVAKLSNCQIKRKWMLNISPQSPANQETLELYISLTCDVELFLSEGLSFCEN